MNAVNAPEAKDPGSLHRALLTYDKETGQSLGCWALIAALNLAAQIIFRRELNPGEFGTLNTALGAIGLMTLPALALNQAFTHYFAREHAGESSARIGLLRASALIASETFALVWGGLCLVLVFVLSTLLGVPRFSLELFLLLNVLIAVGSVISGAVCERGHRLRLWAGLLTAAAFARVLAGAGLTSQQPWAEAGLAAVLLAGLITMIPALQARETTFAARRAAWRAVLDRDFLLCAGATFSVLLALFLFSSADRVVAQSCFGTTLSERIPVSTGSLGAASSEKYTYVTSVVDWNAFDGYQTAGLLARALLWGTQPLLWILFAHRSQLARTTPASLTFFWIYLGALPAGALLLGGLAQPLSRLFCGADFQSTAHFVPSLAATMVPLGLLQALGVFSLASRRYHECFTLGACSIGYAFILFFFARQPLLMPAYMFGGSLISLMILLFVGVVRWGRKQP
jgi:hypothetical protein